MAHKWSQITDLPTDVASLASPELKSIAGIWKEQAARLQQINAVQAFNARLAREWSIETGVIENGFATAYYQNDFSGQWLAVPVPEPTAMGLLLLGTGLTWRGRKLGSAARSEG